MREKNKKDYPLLKLSLLLLPASLKRSLLLLPARKHIRCDLHIFRSDAAMGDDDWMMHVELGGRPTIDAAAMRHRWAVGGA